MAQNMTNPKSEAIATHTLLRDALLPSSTSSQAKAATSRPSSPQPRPVSPNPGRRGGIVVFSGGSAANNLVDVFERVREANRASLSYVIPISDNGGSTSEIIRVFGGPGT